MAACHDLRCGPRIQWREGTPVVSFPGIRDPGGSSEERGCGWRLSRLSHVTRCRRLGARAGIFWPPLLPPATSSTPSGAAVEAGPAGACHPAVPVLSGGSYPRRGWETGSHSQSDSREPSDPHTLSASGSLNTEGTRALREESLQRKQPLVDSSASQEQEHGHVHPTGRTPRPRGSSASWST